MRKALTIAACAALAASQIGACAHPAEPMLYGHFGQAATHPLTGDAELGRDYLSFTDNRYLRTEVIGAFDINRPSEPGSQETWAERLALSYNRSRVIAAELRRVRSEAGPPLNGLCRSGPTTQIALVQTAERRGDFEFVRLVVIAFSGEAPGRSCGWTNYHSVRRVSE